jgi:hypothetical protein
MKRFRHSAFWLLLTAFCLLPSALAQKPKYPYSHGYFSTINDRVVYADAFTGTTTAQMVNAAVATNSSPCLIIITGEMQGTAGDFTGISLPDANYRILDERGPNLVWGFKSTVDSSVVAILTLTQTGITVPSCTGCGGGGTPGGGDTAVQFNHPAGTFAGDTPNFFYNPTTHKLTVTGGLSTGTAAPFTLSFLANGAMTGNVTFTGPTVQPAAGLLNLDASGNMTTKPLQGTDANVLTSGTVSGTASPLCTDANGGATTSGCPAASAPITVLGQQILSVPASSVTFSSIPGTHSDLMLTIRGSGADAALVTNMGIQFNGDVAADYDYTFTSANGTSLTAFSASAVTNMYAGSVPGATATANTAGQAVVYVVGYAGTTFNKSMTVDNGWLETQGSTTTYFKRGVFGQWRSTAAITSVTVLNQSGSNFNAGTRFTLYALN